MPKITHIHKEEYEKLASLLSRYFNKQNWCKTFKIVWDNNPAFQEHSYRGIIVKNQEKIVAFSGNYPAFFQLNGRPEISANSLSLVVEPQFRGTTFSGSRIKKNNIRKTENKINFTTTGRRIVVKMNSKLGYLYLPTGVGSFNVYSIVPINPERTFIFILQIVKSFRSKESMISLSKSTLPLVRYLSGRNTFDNDPGISPSRFSVRRAMYADEQFDALWEATKNYFLHTNIRDSKTLNWYLGMSHIGIELYACYEGSNLCGFMLSRKSSFKNTDYLLCIDLWVRKKDKDAITMNLVAFARKQALRNNCGLLVLPHFSRAISCLYQNRGLIQIVGAKRNDMYRPPQNAHSVIDENNSYFTYMHGDRFFVPRPI